MVQDKKKASTLYSDIAKTAKVKPKDVASVFVAARVVIARDLRHHFCCKVPALAHFKLRNIPPRPGKTKLVFGKEMFIKAKAATKHLRVIPSKQMKDAVMG